ncbi:MAG: 4'-phosphopantetheinyl transferase superfamily protein [Thermodesulfobacteriota bacterium]
MTPLPDGYPLAIPSFSPPSVPWAEALGLDGPLPMVLLDLSPLAAPLGPAQLAALLSAGEEARYHAFQYPKRRQEWLGGRLAAKAAVCELLATFGSVPPPSALTIGADGAGKPRLELPGLPRPVHLSLSHSAGCAAAMACFQPCGIDLQAVGPTVGRVKQRFALPGEEAILAAAAGHHPETVRLTLLWAAKEAIRKMVPLPPLPGFRDIVLIEAQPAGAGHLFLFSAGEICHNAHRPLRVAAALLDNYALAAGALPSTD